MYYGRSASSNNKIKSSHNPLSSIQSSQAAETKHYNKSKNQHNANDNTKSPIDQSDHEYRDVINGNDKDIAPDEYDDKFYPESESMSMSKNGMLIHQLLTR